MPFLLEAISEMYEEDNRKSAEDNKQEQGSHINLWLLYFFDILIHSITYQKCYICVVTYLY